MPLYQVNKDTGLDLTETFADGTVRSVNIPRNAILILNANRNTIYINGADTYALTIPENDMVHLTLLPATPRLIRQNAIRVHNNDDPPPGGGSAMMVNRRSKRRSTRRSKRRSTRRSRR